MHNRFARYLILLLGIGFSILFSACIEKPALVPKLESTSQAAPALQWSMIFGGGKDDKGRSVQQTTDGGYIVCGITESYGVGSEDVWLLKTDADGNKLWDKTFGGGNDDIGISAQQTRDGGYIVCGSTFSYRAGDEDILLIKTDAAGNKLWDKTFGGTGIDVGWSAQQTIEGGYVACGGIGSEAKLAVRLIKTDANGRMVWDKTFGGTGIAIGHSVKQTADGGYIICGRILAYSSEGQGIWLIKTDVDGNKLWDKTFGGEGIAVGRSVQQTGDDGYIICGTLLSYQTPKIGAWLIKTDADGNKLWDKIFTNSNGNSVQQTRDGGYIMCGDVHSDGPSGGAEAWLVKTDTEGNEVWNETLNNADGYSVQQTSDGGYIICGEIYSSDTGTYDVLLLKIAPEQ